MQPLWRCAPPVKCTGPTSYAASAEPHLLHSLCRGPTSCIASAEAPPPAPPHAPVYFRMLSSAIAGISHVLSGAWGDQSINKLIISITAATMPFVLIDHL